MFGVFYFMESFGARLESLRGSRTQKAFAAELGVPHTTYTNWVLGVSMPKADAIVSLCLRLGASADWLLGLSSDGAPAQLVTKAGGKKRTA